MSRAYRISVKEGVTKIICADDEVSTDLEIVEVLPQPEMTELLEKELEKRGFKKEGEVMVRHEENKNITVTVDAKTGTVTVSSKDSATVHEEVEKTGNTYNENDGTAQDKLREAAKKELQAKVDKKNKKLQEEVSARLEGELADIQQELDKVINKVTADALKQKARSMGTIKELSEDEATGNLVIVVEV